MNPRALRRLQIFVGVAVGPSVFGKLAPSYFQLLAGPSIPALKRFLSMVEAMRAGAPPLSGRSRQCGYRPASGKSPIAFHRLMGPASSIGGSVSTIRTRSKVWLPRGAERVWQSSFCFASSSLL